MIAKNIVYSHWSAALRWNIPFKKSFFEREITAAENGLLNHVMVFRLEDRMNKKNLYVHQITSNDNTIPIVNFNGENIVGLEHVLIQLANELSVQRTIVLGMLMCSAPDGQNPLITVEKLISYANSTSKLEGRVTALRALKYVRNHARSGTEVILHMILTLPHSLGGFNLGEAKFNKTVILPRIYAEKAKQSSYVLDIYFPASKLAVEYQGKHHKTTVEEDLQRKAILENLGYKVVYMYTQDVYNLEKFQVKLTEIVQYLKKRIRIRGKDFAPNFMELHKMLPRFNPIDETDPAAFGAYKKELFSFLSNHLSDELLESFSKKF